MHCNLQQYCCILLYNTPKLKKIKKTCLVLLQNLAAGSLVSPKRQAITQNRFEVRGLRTSLRFLCARGDARPYQSARLVRGSIMLSRLSGRLWPRTRPLLSGASYLNTHAGSCHLANVLLYQIDSAEFLCSRLTCGQDSLIAGLRVSLCTTGPVINEHPCNNVSPSVAAKIGKDLHRRPAHPLGIIKERWAIVEFCPQWVF